MFQYDRNPLIACSAPLSGREGKFVRKYFLYAAFHFVHSDRAPVAGGIKLALVWSIAAPIFVRASITSADIAAA